MNDPTPHEKTRIRQLEDASAHWERKYANARQYNRNLEERIASLEARCRELEGLLSRVNNCRGSDFKRIAELEAALREIIDPNRVPYTANLIALRALGLESETGAKS